ncbi:alpha-(1-2)-phosphatidylinositol mannoside mannosyltransferase [Mariniluteicoccus endophyticus]
MTWVRRIALALVYAIPPLFAAVYAGATGIKDGQFYPWRPIMLDLDVYIRTGERVLAGQPFYAVPGDQFPFIYPPIAAVMSAPLALLDTHPMQVVWLLLNALIVMACVHRLRFTGWQLSLVSVAALWLIQPIRVTLGFGQVNLVLLMLVFLDLMPGPRLLGRRFLPEGWMTGVATAIKLTPLIFSLYLFCVGKVRAGLVSLASTAAATILGFILLPSSSVQFWSRLIAGDSGFNVSMKYYANQSMIGNYIRFTKLNPDKIPLEGMLLACIVGGLGLLAAILWHRQGHHGFGLCLAAFAGLFMSPISWSHHFVWVLPLVIILLRDTRLPDFLRFVGLGFCLWVMWAPFDEFIDGQNEFEWPLPMLLIDAGSLIIGTAFFILAAGMAIAQRRRLGMTWLPLTFRAEEAVPAPASVGPPGEHDTPGRDAARA